MVFDILASAGIAAAGLLMFRHGRASVLEEVPDAPPLDDLVTGTQNHVTGTARHVESLREPDTAAPCVYYRLERTHVLPGGREEKVEVREQRVPFYLEDGSGRVMVDPRGAEVTAPLTVASRAYIPDIVGIEQLLGKDTPKTGHLSTRIWSLREGTPLNVKGYYDGHHLTQQQDTPFSLQAAPYVHGTNQAVFHAVSAMGVLLVLTGVFSFFFVV